MGCSNAKMVQVGPQNMKEASSNIDTNSCVDMNNNAGKAGQISNKRMSSATSNKSGQSRDSAFIEGDTDSIISASRSTRGHSGGLKRTLRGLSARSRKSIEPLKDETSVLQQLRSEGLLLKTDTHKAKSGLSFELYDENSEVRKIKPPARLKSLEKRQNKRKLLTQQDIEAKLAKAERRRKEAEAERVGKIQSVTAQSDIHHALDSFMEHQQQKKEQVQDKVDNAAENRAQKMREMREKLREKEAHAALVRNRKKSLAPVKIAQESNISTQSRQTEE